MIWAILAEKNKDKVYVKQDESPNFFIDLVSRVSPLPRDNNITKQTNKQTSIIITI